MYSIGQFAELTGVTIRTLRYYHEKELLIPSYISESNRRYYTDSDIAILQNITTLQYIGYSLIEIKEIISHGDHEMHTLLEQQRYQLVQKRERLNKIIDSIEIAIQLSRADVHFNKTSLLTIINELSKESEQKQYLSNYFSEKWVEKIYEHSNNKTISNHYQQFYELVHRIKDLYQNRVSKDENEIKASLQKLKNFVPAGMEEEIKMNLNNKKIDPQEYRKYFTSPFTKAEETWLREKFEQYKNDWLR